MSNGQKQPLLGLVRLLFVADRWILFDNDILWSAEYSLLDITVTESIVNDNASSIATISGLSSLTLRTLFHDKPNWPTRIPLPLSFRSFLPSVACRCVGGSAQTTLTSPTAGQAAGQVAGIGAVSSRSPVSTSERPRTDAPRRSGTGGRPAAACWTRPSADRRVEARDHHWTDVRHERSDPEQGRRINR